MGLRGVRLLHVGARQGGSSEGQKFKRRRLYQMESASFLNGDQGRVLDLAFCPVGELLLAAGQDGTVQLWSSSKRRQLRSFCMNESHQATLALDWLPTGHYFVSSGLRGTSLLWSVERDSPVRCFQPPGFGASVSEVQLVRTHPSAQYAVVISSDRVTMWDLPAARPARVFATENNVTSVGFSTDGKLLAIGSRDGCIELWDVASSKRQQQIHCAHEGPIWTVDFSWPCGTSGAAGKKYFLFSAGQDQQMRLWSCPGKRGAPLDVALPQSVPLHAQGNSASALTSAVLCGRFTLRNELMVVCVDQGMGIKQIQAEQAGRKLKVR